MRATAATADAEERCNSNGLFVLLLLLLRSSASRASAAASSASAIWRIPILGVGSEDEQSSPAGSGRIGMAGYGHSDRNADAGSIDVARRAGSQLASAPTDTISATTAAYVQGSVALTPYNSAFSVPDTAIAPTMPNAAPLTVTRSELPSTRRTTSARDAPSAMRTPSSCDCCRTEYDTTP